MTFKTSIFTLAFAGASALALISTASPSYAQTDIVEQAESVVQAVTESLPDVENQAFFKKKYRIKGTWSLITRDDKRFIVFSDDFKTKNGPDLKIFLSPKSAEDVTGKNAVDGALNLGVLIKNKPSPILYSSCPLRSLCYSLGRRRSIGKALTFLK